MKKIVIFSVLIACLLIQTSNIFANGRQHGHRAYVKHSKHHKAHKLHRAHGLVDATYQMYK